MMGNKYILPAVALLFTGFALFVTCKESGGSRKSTKIAFDSIVVKQQIPLLQENDTTLPFADAEVRFIYPQKFRDAESLTRLQQIFVGTFFGDTAADTLTPQDAVNRYMEEYTSRYKALSNSFYENKARLNGAMPAWYWYTMSNRNKILFQNDSLLSYAVEYSDYEGGAHGSYRITYVNINLNNLTTLSEEDLFVPDYFKPLTEKIVHQLMNRYDASVPDSLLMRGFFTLEDIMPNNNFWLDGEGMHYAYNQFEIAPYSMGIIDVTIPYSELTDILLPDGIIPALFLQEQ